MAQECPECGAATAAARWCASCGAWLGGPVSPGVTGDRGRGHRVGAAVAVVVAAAAVAVLGSDEEAEVPDTSTVVPVEDAEVLPPTVPPLAGPVGRRFSVEATILWGRRLATAADDGWSLRPIEGGVALLDDGRPVLRVDAASGEDVLLPGAVPSRADLVFDVAAGPVTVDGRDDALRGVVDGEVVWSTDLGAPTTVAPIRAGTSVVVALRNGEVAALSPVDGTDRWRRDLGVVPTAVAGNGTVLLVGTADGRVLRLDPSGVPVTSARVGDGPVLALAAGRPAVVLLADRLVGLDVTG